MGSWPSKLNSVTGKRPLRDNLFGLLFWTNWDGIYNWNNYADIYCIWIGKRIYNKICDFKINWCEKIWQWCGVDTVSVLEVDCNSAPTWGRIGTLVKQICGGSYVSAFYVVIWLTHTFIFIGCGFSDPDIQLVLENYSFVFPGSPCHYFITSKDGINTEYKRIVKENRNLEIITYDSKDNHRELHDALEELVPMVEDERTRIAKEMDW